MTIVKQLVAESSEELEELSWRTHDAEFDPAELAFDATAQIVTVPFIQEPRDVADGVPASVHVRSTWRFEEYAVPFLRCSLLIHNASDLRVPTDFEEEAGALTSVSVDEGDGTVRVWANVDKLEVVTSRLRVELVITDEIADVRRRRVGRGRRWDSTMSWPADRRDGMRALVRGHQGPPPQLHEVSSIVRPPD
jgi:hypothetical protein